MPKIAFIGGSGFKREHFLKDFKQHVVKTMYGNVLLYVKDKVVFLPRHGKNGNIPPHRISHKANICALNLLGVEKIFAINSVGSLNEKIKPGTLLIPDDYVDFSPDTFFEIELRSIAPELSEKLRKELIDAAKKARTAVKTSGIYVRTRGPRFETKAEIKVLKKWGDVVGMTMTQEATLAQELGLPYACICTVDNYVHGLSKKKLSEEQVHAVQKKNAPKIEKIIKEIIAKNQ